MEGAKRAVSRFSQPDSAVHAVLLYGSEGAGKEKLANALVRAWLCKNPFTDGACGVCQACEAFGRDRSADLVRIAPWGKSDWIKQEAITPTKKTGDSEDDFELLPMTEFFRTRPLSARNKVALMLRVDRLYPSAANAFLKTLEEPNPNCRVVMTTSDIGLVLPTIVSRCVSVACELPSKAVVSGANPTATHDMIDLGEGAPGRLAHVLAHAEAYGRVASFARKLLTARQGHSLALSEEFRAICDGIEESLGKNARGANVEGLRALGAALSAQSNRDDWFTLIAEAHRRIQGNGNEGMVLDAMFAAMLRA